MAAALSASVAATKSNNNNSENKVVGGQAQGGVNVSRKERALCMKSACECVRVCVWYLVKM